MRKSSNQSTNLVYWTVSPKRMKVHPPWLRPGSSAALATMWTSFDGKMVPLPLVNNKPSLSMLQRRPRSSTRSKGDEEESQKNYRIDTAVGCTVCTSGKDPAKCPWSMVRQKCLSTDATHSSTKTLFIVLLSAKWLSWCKTLNPRMNTLSPRSYPECYAQWKAAKADACHGCETPPS